MVRSVLRSAYFPRGSVEAMSDETPTAESVGRQSARLGARTAVPLAFAAFPFGLVYGVAVSESTISAWLGGAASWIILAGAAQLSLLALIDSDAAWVVAVGTALVINARFALYSAALAPAFAQFPKRWRFTLPYLMTDQAATMGLAHFDEESDPVRRRWFYLGAALLFSSAWWVGTITGVLVGGSLPEELDIGFAVPAMFIALLVPTLVNVPAAVAATVGAAVTVIAAPLPNGLNILVGALAGIAAGRTTLPKPADR